MIKIIDKGDDLLMLNTQIYGFLEYIWIPIILPFMIFMAKSVLYVKEIKNGTDSEIEEFIQLYTLRIKEHLRISSEEILRFINNRKGESIEHHLYILKKFNKVVGFVKFMYSVQYKYIFIAYIAIDKDDLFAKKYGTEYLVKKIYKKYLKKKKARMMIMEIERNNNNDNYYLTAFSRLISRYAKKKKMASYVFDFEYMQPQMPDEQYNSINEEILSLVYVPIFKLANQQIEKNKLIELLRSIYFEIYYPSCNSIKSCDSNDYNSYLKNLIELYEDLLPSYINLIEL